MNIEFYFYYGCPWTYLAFARLRETAMRSGAGIVWKPVLVDRVQQIASGGTTAHARPTPGSAKARYQVKDLADWATFCGLDIRHPGPFPLAGEWAVRGGIVAARDRQMPAYSDAIFRACFRDRQDIAALDVVLRIAQEAGLGGNFAAAIRDEQTLRAAEANSAELVSRGGFGSPTMFIGDDMYFGNDRMPLVEFALNRAPERRFIPPGAHGQT